MPLIPEIGCEDLYREFLVGLLQRVPVERLTLGGVCSYARATSLMEYQLGTSNAISENLERRRSPDGRKRYPVALRGRFYRLLAELAQKLRPEMPVSLCMEEPEVWQELRNQRNVLRDVCNCVL